MRNARLDNMLTSAASKSFLNDIPGLTLTVHAVRWMHEQLPAVRMHPRCIQAACHTRRRRVPRRVRLRDLPLTLALKINDKIDLRLDVFLLLFCHGERVCKRGWEMGGKKDGSSVQTAGAFGVPTLCLQH